LDCDHLAESVKFDKFDRIGKNAHMDICQAPRRVYRGIDVGIVRHFAYVNDELGTSP
jgi:hypothetical protein